MSVAIRKRSWEEHVTQWMGQLSNSDDNNIACHHGLVADSLQASMEQDAALNVEHREKCASLPDCCHGYELRDFSGRPMGHISKEVEENYGPEGEDQFLSLEASTETLVHISDEDGDSDLYPTDDNHILTTEGQRTSGPHSIKGAGSLEKKLPIMECKGDSSNSWGMAGGTGLAPIEERSERKVVNILIPNLELCNVLSLSEIKDASQMNACDSVDGDGTEPEKQLLDSAVIAQQQRKADFSKDDQEGNTCSPIPDAFLAIPWTDRGLPLLEADSGSCLMQSPSCPRGMSAEDSLEKRGFSEHQNNLPKVNSGDGMQCLRLKETLATQEPTENQVRLRKRKEIKEDRARVRLDSMVLLIMKLDQLDQDIENALSTSSSTSSTPTNMRRHVPDLESGSESGTDAMPVNQTQINLFSNTEPMDLPSSTPVTSSGTKPKSTVVK